MLPITIEHPIRTSRTFYNYLVAKFGAQDLLLERLWNIVPSELTTVTTRGPLGTDNRGKGTQPKASQTGRKQKTTDNATELSSSDTSDTDSEKQDEDEEEDEEEDKDGDEGESESESMGPSESESASESSDTPSPRNARNHKKTIPATTGSSNHPRVGEKRPPQVSAAPTKPAKKARTEPLRPSKKK
jgi:hypothetical protein